MATEDKSWKWRMAVSDSAKTPKPVLVTGFVFSESRSRSEAQA